MKRSQRGNVLAAVLVAAFLIMAVGLGVLRQATMEHGISRRAADWESAFYEAWAGVEHSLAVMNARFPDYVGRPPGEVVLSVPQTALGNGSYAVTVTSLGNNRYKAVATGRSRSETRTLAATLAFGNASAAYYHIWGSENYNIGGNSVIKGDLYSADEISLDGGTHVVRTPSGIGGNLAARNKITLGGTVVVDGDVTAREVVLTGSPVVKGKISTGFGPEVSMPEITLTGIKAMTPALLNPTNPTANYTLDCTKTTGRHAACDGGYYLHKGDLTVYGEFKGRTVVGVEGTTSGGARKVEIAKDIVKPADCTCVLAVVGDGNSSLTLKGGLTVEALLYTTDQRVDLPGAVTVHGAIIAHKVDNNGNLFFAYDEGIGDMMPGLPGVRLIVKEWREE
ncbi:MAG TPA: hypothetical protein VD902_04895 [Symbiobacteriaceae bacterium]|nr:hypothetical protein [Symbiobacteriaceae bacterium]